jgi:glutaredoxin 3
LYELNDLTVNTFIKFVQFPSVNLIRKFAHLAMGDVKALVDSKIAGKKVVVFSKSFCPYCDKAKKALSKYVGNTLPADEYDVLEIDGLPNCEEIQDYLKTLTGARSVPRVFIKGNFVGGGDDIVAKDKSGELKALLA